MIIFREMIKRLKFWQRPHKDSVGTEQDFWARCCTEVNDGRRLDPVLMSDIERREATRRVTKGMRWSSGFTKAMSVPILLRALEGGGVARDPLTGDEIDIKDNPTFGHVGQLTRQDFIADNAAWKANPFMFNQPKPEVGEEL
jgi:hypothetical protein